MPIKDKWAISTSEEDEADRVNFPFLNFCGLTSLFKISFLSDSYTKVTPSKYAPVVELRRRKKRKEEKMSPPVIISRFPGGGFAARMKKVMDEKQGKGASKTVPDKMLSGASTTKPTRKKGTLRKKIVAKEGSIVQCVKKERKENNQCRMRSSPAVGKKEEVVIEDFNSQELLQGTPVVAAKGFSGGVKSTINGRKVGCHQGQDKSEGVNSGGLIPGTSWSKTVVINSQPQFAPSQPDEERQVVVVVKPKDLKQGILKKRIPLMKPTRKSDMLEAELLEAELLEENQNQGSVALAGMLSDIGKEKEEQEDITSVSDWDAVSDEGEVKEQGKSLEDEAVAKVLSKENKELSEEDVDELADMFSDY